jgi:RNA polymerase sigma-B factor
MQNKRRIHTPSSTQLAAAELRCREYAATRDRDLRATIVDDYQWLVGICAMQMRRPGEQLDDLEQVANIGLLQALERFDPAMGCTFRTYASSTILGVIRRHYRTVWRVKVPRRLQHETLAIAAATDHLTMSLQRTPTIADVAHHLRLSEHEVSVAMSASSGYMPGELLVDAGERIRTTTEHGDPFADLDDKVIVARLLGTLPERHRAIVFMHYFEDKTQRQIAEVVGVSQVQISRLLTDALQRLRRQPLAADRDLQPVS